MKVAVKLSRSEHEVLRHLFETRVNGLETNNTIDRMVLTLLDEVYFRLWKKGPNPASGSLTMSEPEAIAFWSFWTAQELPATMWFEQNMLRRINSTIHQKLLL